MLLETQGDNVAVWAIDSSPEMIRLVTEQWGHRLGAICASAESYAQLFPPQSIDCVIMANAIHLLDDVEGFFKQTRRVLRPRGRLAFSTAFHIGSECPRDRSVYLGFLIEVRKILKDAGIQPRELGGKGGEKRRRDEATYAALLRQAGLDIVATQKRWVTLDSSFLRAIASSPPFATGLLPGLPPALACQIAGAAAQRMIADHPDVNLTRQWLFMVAQIPRS